jgi:hypothetical protein
LRYPCGELLDFGGVGEFHGGGVPFELLAGDARGDVAEHDGLGERAGVVEAVGGFFVGEDGIHPGVVMAGAFDFFDFEVLEFVHGIDDWACRRAAG